MKPANIIYGLKDQPPLPVLLVSTAQQTAATAAISFATVITVLDYAGTDLATTSNALRVAMLALGIVTLLHCIRFGHFGTGYLIPAVFATSYLPGMMLAAKMGGLPLVFGMTIIAGAMQSLMSVAVPRLRPFFPAEIAGFVVFMIGLGMGIIGIRAIAGSGESTAEFQGVVLGVLSLAAIVVVTIWGRGMARTFSVLIGIAVGYLAAFGFGLGHPAVVATGWGSGLFSFPAIMTDAPQFSLAPELMLPFLVGALACTLRTMGDVTTCQKLNDARWQRPDLRTIEGGILASGVGNIICGLIGSIGCNTSSSGIGLSGATGVTSRRVGYAMAALLVLLSFIPGLAVLLAIMPRPVLGAVLLFTGSLVIMNGLQIILSRVIDMRKTIVVGISMVLGIGHDIFPQIFRDAPTWIQPFVKSSVVLSIVTALLLNFLFRLGIRRSVEISFTPDETAAETMYGFMLHHGGAWAARQDVIQRAVRALSEFAEISPGLVEPDTQVQVTASFDEYRLKISLRYRGTMLEIARTLPTEDEILEDDTATTRLSSILIARATDRIEIKQDGEMVLVELIFNH